MCIRSSKEHITWVLQIERDFIAEYNRILGGVGGLDTQHPIELSEISRSILCIEFFFWTKLSGFTGLT